MSQGNLIRGLNVGPGGTGGNYFIEVDSVNGPPGKFAPPLKSST